MPKDALDNYTDDELRVELEDRARGVKAADRKVEAADAADESARKVEAIAARIEAEEPAVSTEEATARAKAEVDDPDPFHTVKGYTAEIDVKTGKLVEDVEPGDKGETDKTPAAAEKSK